MAPKKKPLDVEEKKKIKRDNERRRRAKIKADPEKYEEAKKKERERRQRRKEEKKILLIGDMSRRSQKAQRQAWRERASKSRHRKKCTERGLRLIRENTPSSEEESDGIQAPDMEVSSPIREHNATPAESESDMATPLRDDSSPMRLRNTTPTGRESDGSIPERIGTPSSVSSRDSTMSRQRRQGLKQAKKHREVSRILIMKQKEQIRNQQMKLRALQVKIHRLVQKIKQMPIAARKKQKAVREAWFQRKLSVKKFLEEDENSMISPGVKDTITKNKIKKQKRFLTDSIENLHKKYNAVSERSLRVSYASFCRLRPFWIVRAKLTDRDTCMCVFHENFNMMLNRLKALNIIENGCNVIRSVVCDTNSYACMSRKCSKCLNKNPNFLTFQNEEISYHQWISQTEERNINGRIKSIRRTVKARLLTDKKGLVEKFLNVLPKFLLHTFNISNQHKTLNHIRDNLAPGEILIRIDFSENFACKYFSEVQSVHFGASRQQVSIHTGVLYYFSEVTGKTDSVSFSSVSDCLRHDAAAVYAHLKIALSELTKHQNIKVLHIASDGPSSQYKNKNNFYLFSQHLVNILNVTSATWNFTETAHGKGPADGVGAAVKEVANNYIRKGNDIPDYETFVRVVKTNCNVLLFEVSENDINDAEKLVKSSKIKIIPGTKKMHQLTWSIDEPRILNIRELTCVNCGIKDICQHYPSAKKEIVRLLTSDVGPSRVQNSDLVEPIVDNSFATNQTELREGTWVLAKFAGKKNQFSLYVGQIINIEKDNHDEPYNTKFTRKKYHNVISGDTVFTWKHDDFASLSADHIVSVLQEPTPTRRGELVFKFDFSLFDYPVM